MAETEIVRIQFVEILFNATRAGQVDLPLNRLPEWVNQHGHPVLITRIERLATRPIRYRYPCRRAPSSLTSATSSMAGTRASSIRR